MSREILFRGKHIHAMDSNEHLNGTWVHGYLSDKDYIYDKSLEGEFLVDKNTICQYTGLNDMSDTKIWENDIVKIGDCRGVIRYKDGCFSIKWINDPLEIRRTDLAHWVHFRTIQVIGNVFDNLGLLEKNEENKHGEDI